MSRTDFTQEIDGALAGRNLGQRHFSEIARSGNGDMRTDLSEDLADFHQLDGVGESIEEVTPAESAQIDIQGPSAKIPSLRWPAPGELPPYAAKAGSVWLRSRTLTGTRKPGGKRLVKVRWVMVSKDRLLALQREGAMGDLPSWLGIGTISSVGIGLAGGLVLWLLLKRRK
jgi:hypothetical protein